MMNRKELLMDVIEDLTVMKRKMMQHRDCVIGTKQRAHQHPTHAQMGILFMLESGKSLNLKEIAKHMQTTSSAVTQQINELVKSGYISRKEDGKDRRKTSLSLTTTGKKKIIEMKKAHIAHFTKMLSPLTDDELRQWQTIQHKIIENLK